MKLLLFSKSNVHAIMELWVFKSLWNYRWLATSLLSKQTHPVAQGSLSLGHRASSGYEILWSFLLYFIIGLKCHRILHIKIHFFRRCTGQKRKKKSFSRNCTLRAYMCACVLHHVPTHFALWHTLQLLPRPSSLHPTCAGQPRTPVKESVVTGSSSGAIGFYLWCRHRSIRASGRFCKEPWDKWSMAYRWNGQYPSFCTLLS